MYLRTHTSWKTRSSNVPSRALETQHTQAVWMEAQKNRAGFELRCCSATQIRNTENKYLKQNKSQANKDSGNLVGATVQPRNLNMTPGHRHTQRHRHRHTQRQVCPPKLHKHVRCLVKVVLVNKQNQVSSEHPVLQDLSQATSRFPFISWKCCSELANSLFQVLSEN